MLSDKNHCINKIAICEILIISAYGDMLSHTMIQSHVVEQDPFYYKKFSTLINTW